MKILLASLLVAVGTYFLSGYGSTIKEGLALGVIPLTYYCIGLLIGKECA